MDERLHGLQGQVVARAAQVALQAAQAARMTSSDSFGTSPESSGSTTVCMPGLNPALCKYALPTAQMTVQQAFLRWCMVIVSALACFSAWSRQAVSLPARENAVRDVYQNMRPLLKSWCMGWSSMSILHHCSQSAGYILADTCLR